ncbi:helix-turn-helix domain-containing protein [Fimbriiglobus ruber]|uniref:Mobile element protein n=1 Tax=Fimbriiglobus ruber TaxID=1908690 RepID=A0A225DLC8_9BACT|nr:helix-turn-helix domain-containing protein [Fimbriiglobus ruber]OWK39358.1 Mobile element protein [Fimbriiglobus ruber]
MSHQLTVAMSESILTLHQRGWSQRRIAHELGIDREIVARHLRLAAAEPNPATAGTGPQAIPAESNPATALTGSHALLPESAPARSAPDTPGRQVSDCEPYRDTIRAQFDLGLSIQRIFQDLVTEYGFAGSYHSVRRFANTLGVKQELRNFSITPRASASRAGAPPNRKFGGVESLNRSLYRCGTGRSLADQLR